MHVRLVWFRFVLMALLLSGCAYADSAAFDLSGPRVEVNVTRAGKTLPISEVPNLQPGDRLWLHPDLPPSQSVHYVMVAAFLRGSTNPPPEEWFTKAETWDKNVREEGIVVTVPKEARQALVFLAPETGGDFGAIRSAVRGKPGAFVRASQDLEQASLNRSRLEEYLKAVRESSSTDPKALKERSTLLARSLGIKLNEDCFNRPAEQQITCLTQNSDQLVLDDPHTQSMVSTLTSGAASDLIGHVTSAPLARGGYYSPYVGAVVDIAQLMSGFHTPNYQYIPALALPKKDELNLKLNNPPSFRKPKSVLVIGLPAVETVQLPPLHAIDPGQISCLQKSPLVLQVEGAPLFFSTAYAYGMVLHLHEKTGPAVDLPVLADAALGGLVIDTRTLPGSKLGPELDGELRGSWGFQTLEGPSFKLSNAHATKWVLSAGDPDELTVGHDDALHLHSDQNAAVCVDTVSVRDPQGKVGKAVWKMTKPDEVEVQMPLKDADPGTFTLLLQQTGLAMPDEVPVHTYSVAAHLDRFVVHAGDDEGVLWGTHLSQVASLQLKGAHFTPALITVSDQKEQLQLTAEKNAPVNQLQPGEKLVAQVTLKDGRVLHLPLTVEAARPKVSLISKSVQPGTSSGGADFRLANQNDLPQNARLSFFLKAETPSMFSRDEKIEISTADDSAHAVLSVADGSLILQDSQTVLALLDPLKSLGPSVFGALRFRPVNGDGIAGDWQPLINLVRIPSLKEVRCPDDAEKACTLIGTDLFLIDSVASNSHFTHAVSVPLGFAASSLPVPRPLGTLLYLKLRDDPSAVNAAALPVLPEE
jgi:hypothetical protein